MVENITFIVPVSDKSIYKKNFLLSPILNKNHSFEIIAQYGFRSASIAYNDAIKKAENDILVFLHQDIILPENWEVNLISAIDFLDKNDNKWGVIGCYGVSNVGKHYGYLYCTGNGGLLGAPFDIPIEVRTLDEIVIVFRKSSGLTFDDSLPHFHFYGTDICLEAARKGRRCYAISAFCLHNSNKVQLWPREFISCYGYIKNKWNTCLPIETSCIMINNCNIDLYYTYIRQIKNSYFKNILFKNSIKGKRIDNPLKILEIFQNKY